MIKLLTNQFDRVKPFQFESTPITVPLPRPKNEHITPTTDILASSVPPISKPKIIIRSVSSQSIYSSVTLENDNWSIQVGSFSRKISAHKAAIKARRSAASILAMIPAEVSLVMRGDLPLWRVRFEGLDETSARAACVKLYQTGNACFALPEIITKTSLL